MRRVALISDIHGNTLALRAVLERIETEGVDTVLCLGDIAATGPHPKEAVAELLRRGIRSVRGNTDDRLATAVDFSNSRGAEIERIDRWCASKLSDEERQYLSSLPMTMRDGDILLYHASPQSNTSGIAPWHSDSEVRARLGRERGLVCAGGHTHVQMLRHVDGAVLINPGSVGLPYRRDADGREYRPVLAEYAIIAESADGMDLSFRAVHYSLEDLESDVLSSGMPESDWYLSKWRR